MSTTNQPGCPYSQGKDHLKMHHLFMPREDAQRVDAEIAAAQSPCCGKPLHPGSRMCQEHVRDEYGYHQSPRSPYPNADAPFRCSHSPMTFGSDKRWLIHDENDHFCAEFENEGEAKAKTDLWISGGAEKITVDWRRPHEDADESDRGTYVIGLQGTNRKIHVSTGWHSMESAARKSGALRDILVTSGYGTVRDIFDHIL